MVALGFVKIAAGITLGAAALGIIYVVFILRPKEGCVWSERYGWGY